MARRNKILPRERIFTIYAPVRWKKLYIKELEQIATESDRSVSWVVRHFIIEGIKEYRNGKDKL